MSTCKGVPPAEESAGANDRREEGLPRYEEAFRGIVEAEPEGYRIPLRTNQRPTFVDIRGRLVTHPAYDPLQDPYMKILNPHLFGSHGNVHSRNDLGNPDGRGGPGTVYVNALELIQGARGNHQGPAIVQRLVEPEDDHPLGQSSESGSDDLGRYVDGTHGGRLNISARTRVRWSSWVRARARARRMRLQRRRLGQKSGQRVRERTREAMNRLVYGAIIKEISTSREPLSPDSLEALAQSESAHNFLRDEIGGYLNLADFGSEIMRPTLSNSSQSDPSIHLYDSTDLVHSIECNNPNDSNNPSDSNDPNDANTPNDSNDSNHDLSNSRPPTVHTMSPDDNVRDTDSSTMSPGDTTCSNDVSDAGTD